MSKSVLLFVLFAVFCSHVYANEKILMCYYGTWATYRPGLGKFDVEQIHPELCTHLVYTFVGINQDGSINFLDPYLDLPDNWGRDNIGKFNALKTLNPRLKTILAVGGWNEGSARYSVMAANSQLRKNFVDSATDTVLKYGFDGFDVDWEYPNRRDTVHGPADVHNFSQLLKELREEFDKYGLLLTAAVASVSAMASLSYDIPVISKYLDIISLMTYDFYGSWDPVTGHNSGLHRGQGDEAIPKEKLYTVDVALQYWLQEGCPPEKLVLGMPLYGRTFTLTNPSVSSVRAPAMGPGLAGPYTRQSGIIGYNEFCEKLQTESWDVRYDDLAKVPFAVQGRNWVSYDDVDSLTLKVEYGLMYGIAGIMVWSIETDDFHGLCHGEDFPLLRNINRLLGRTVGPSSSSTSTTSTTRGPESTPSTSTTDSSVKPSSTTASTSKTSTSTESSTLSPFICEKKGLAPNPKDCSSFYICIEDAKGSLIPKLFNCPNDLHYDATNMICNYPEYVKCTV